MNNSADNILQPGSLMAKEIRFPLRNLNLGFKFPIMEAE